MISSSLVKMMIHFFFLSLFATKLLALCTCPDLSTIICDQIYNNFLDLPACHLTASKLVIQNSANFLCDPQVIKALFPILTDVELNSSKICRCFCSMKTKCGGKPCNCSCPYDDPKQAARPLFQDLLRPYFRTYKPNMWGPVTWKPILYKPTNWDSFPRPTWPTPPRISWEPERKPNSDTSQFKLGLKIGLPSTVLVVSIIIGCIRQCAKTEEPETRTEEEQRLNDSENGPIRIIIYPLERDPAQEPFEPVARQMDDQPPSYEMSTRTTENEENQMAQMNEQRLGYTR